MSLLDRLLNLARQLPPSHEIGATNVTGVLSALLLVEEHGEAILHAAEDAEQGVVGFLHEHAEKVAAEEHNQAQQPGQPAAASPAATPGPVPSQPSAAPGTPAWPNTQPAPAATEPLPAPDAPASAPIQPQPQPAGTEEQPSYAELVAEVQRLRAQQADDQRATVTSDPPPAAAEPTSIATPQPPDTNTDDTPAAQQPPADPPAGA